jgi:hypothetical protein
MANTPRKRPTPVLTPSKTSIVEALATEIWGKLYVKPEKEEDVPKVYDASSDQLQVLIGLLRKARDAAKPVIRERLDTDTVIQNSIGKNMGDLQTAYIQVPVVLDEQNKALITQRMNIPQLRKITEQVQHPYHEAVNKFMKAHKITFKEQEKAGRGKAATTLETTVKAQQPKAA